jgi:hypothetical protein
MVEGGPSPEVMAAGGADLDLPVLMTAYRMQTGRPLARLSYNEMPEIRLTGDATKVNL